MANTITSFPGVTHDRSRVGLIDKPQPPSLYESLPSL